MKKFLAAILFGVLLFGCVNPPPEEKLAVEYGDNVSAYYILSVDGVVKDTNIESVARENGLYMSEMPQKYQPFVFNALLGGGIINGFVNGVVGMGVNETRSFTVPPEEGYGAYDSSLRYNISRYYDLPMIEEVPPSYFHQRNITIEDGISFETEIGTVFISGYTDEYVNLTYIFQEGDIFYYANLPHKVMVGTNYTYKILRDVVLNQTYYTLSPVTNQLSFLKVVEIGNETITFDENPALAGKYLDYQVTVVNITRQSSG